MNIGELSKRLQAYLESEGCRLDTDAPDAPIFAGTDPASGLCFVFNLPGEQDDEVGEYGVELQVFLPLLEWSSIDSGEESSVKELLARQDTLPCSSNSLGYVCDATGKPTKITLQGSTGLQDMSREDEKDVHLLLESLALDSVDAMVPLTVYQSR